MGVSPLANETGSVERAGCSHGFLHVTAWAAVPSAQECSSIDDNEEVIDISPIDLTKRRSEFRKASESLG
jgi:hypothetical protein